MTGQRIGYVRVGTLDQNEKRQLEGQVLDRVFTDKASGRDTARPELTELLRFAATATPWWCTVWIGSRATSMTCVPSFRASPAGGVRVEFVKESLVFTGEDSPMANLMLSVMGAFAEFERSLSRERQREGIALAKQRGAYKGRKKTLTPERADELVQRAGSGVSKAVLARDYGISRETVYQYLRQARMSGTPSPTVRLWDADTGQPAGEPMTGHTVPVSVGSDGALQRWPVPASWTDALCAKLTQNISHKQWREWVSPYIAYMEVCPGLPIPPDDAAR